MSNPDARYWVLQAGVLPDATVQALYPHTNCYPHLLRPDGSVNRDADGRIKGLRYSLDGSHVLIRHAYNGPKGPPPQWVLDALAAVAVAGPLTLPEVRQYLRDNAEDWQEAQG